MSDPAIRAAGPDAHVFVLSVFLVFVVTGSRRPAQRDRVFRRVVVSSCYAEGGAVTRVVRPTHASPNRPPAIANGATAARNAAGLPIQ